MTGMQSFVLICLRIHLVPPRYENPVQAVSWSQVYSHSSNDTTATWRMLLPSQSRPGESATLTSGGRT